MLISYAQLASRRERGREGRGDGRVRINTDKSGVEMTLSLIPPAIYVDLGSYCVWEIAEVFLT